MFEEFDIRNNEIMQICSVYSCFHNIILIGTNVGGILTEGTDEEKRILSVDYSIFIVIKSTSNQMSLYSFEYSDIDKSLSICPYEDWTPKIGIARFIPDDDIKNKGYNNISNSKERYIVTPIYNKKKNDKFFLCGILKQSSIVPDIKIGFNLIYKNPTTNYSDNIDIMDMTIKCIDENISNENYVFSLTNPLTDPNNKTIINFIGYTPLKKETRYIGETIYLYEKTYVDDVLTNIDTDNYETLREYKHFRVTPRCVRRIESDLFVTLKPRLQNIDIEPKLLEKSNMFLYKISEKFMNKPYKIKCVSLIEEEYNEKYEDFVSKSAIIAVYKEYGMEDVSNRSITFGNDLKDYGKYKCIITNMTEAYVKAKIKVRDTLIIPPDNYIFKFQYTTANPRNNTHVNCKKSYPQLGYLKYIEFIFESGNKTINVTLIDILEGQNIVGLRGDKIILKKSFGYKYVNVYCIYETLAGTNVKTSQYFNLPPNYAINPSISGYKYNKEDIVKIIILLLAIGVPILLFICIIITNIISKRIKSTKKQVDKFPRHGSLSSESVRKKEVVQKKVVKNPLQSNNNQKPYPIVKLITPTTKYIEKKPSETNKTIDESSNITLPKKNTPSDGKESSPTSYVPPPPAEETNVIII
uniref:Ig-like domain-containing protein n=1 Tax=Parastrongyloides trichosuri TaxID=131310 RepID=A0A0N4ZMZ5_PARTI